METYVYNGVTYTLPCEIGTEYYSSFGHEINATEVKTYKNGIILTSLEAYSEGNKLISSAGLNFYTIQISGNNAALTGLYKEVENLVKVSKFSWE